MATDHNFLVKNGLDIDGANATIVQDGNETRITSTGEIRFRPEGSSSNKVRITLNTTHISGSLDASANVDANAFRINGTTVIDSDKDITINDKLTFTLNSHYLQAGTNSLSFKNSGGTSYWTSNNTNFSINTNVVLPSGNKIVFGGDDTYNAHLQYTDSGGGDHYLSIKTEHNDTITERARFHAGTGNINVYGTFYTSGSATIGDGVNASLITRHIEGKHQSSNNLDTLYLNYSSTSNVQIGHSGNNNDLLVYGAIRTGSTSRIDINGNLTNIGTISSGHLTVNTSTLKTTNDAIGLFTTDLTVGNDVAQQSTATPKRVFFNNDYSSGYTDASLKLYLFNDSTTRQGFTSGPAYDLQYHSSGSSSGRHAFYVANVEEARIDADGIDIRNGGLDINGTTVIDSSRRFYPANIQSTSSISFLNGSGAQGISVRDIYAGTTYANRTGAAGTVDALNGFKVAGTDVINSSRNLVNIGTISSGAIDSEVSGGDIPSSTNTNLYLVDTRSLAANTGGSIVFSSYYAGTTAVSGGSYIKGYKENATSGDYGYGLKFGIRENGQGSTGPVFTLNSSGNAIFTGTISSGNVTVGDSSTAAYLRAHYSDGSYMTLQGYGLEMNRSTSYIRPTSDNDKTLYIGGVDASLDWNAIHFRSGNGLYMTGTRFLDNGRNLENIGTINTGQGATEVYLMNQNVRTTDSPTFDELTVTDFVKASGNNLKFSAGGTHVLNIDLNHHVYPNTHNVCDVGFSSSLAFKDAYFSGVGNFGTINTGQGATEVHLMNQNVRSSDSPTFADLTVTGNLNITGDINSYNVTDLDVTDKTITLGVGGTSSANNGGGIIIDGASAKLTWSDTAARWTMNKSLQFSDTPTTTNQAMGIFWPGFDKEGTSDYTDNAKIIHTTNTGGHSGSVLLIESQNDANDGIAFVTPSSSYLKHNSNNIFTDAYHPNADTLTTARTIAGTSFDGSANIDISYDNLTNKPTNIANSDTVDSLHASQFLRSDAADTATGIITFAATPTLGGTSANEGGEIQFGAPTGGGSAFAIDNYQGHARIHTLQSGKNFQIIGAGESARTTINTNIGTVWGSNNDGSGSGLDADTLDGVQGSQFLRSDVNDSLFSGNATLQFENQSSFARMAFYKLSLWEWNVGEQLVIDGGVFEVKSSEFRHTSSYAEFGNSTGSVSNDGSWNARLNVAGSSHARLDVKSVSDGIITTMYAHTGHGVGRVGTMSNHSLALMVNTATKATLDSSGNLDIDGNIEHTGLTMTSGTDVDQLKTVTVTATLSTSWQDTGIDGGDLSTGTYIVQVFVDDHSVGGNHYDEYYSGVMSWTSANTNSTVTDEIPLHRAGHAPNAGDFFLRTERTVNADSHDLMLQMRGSTSNSGNSNYVFKFRRMI